MQKGDYALVSFIKYSHSLHSITFCCCMIQLSEVSISIHLPPSPKKNQPKPSLTSLKHISTNKQKWLPKASRYGNHFLKILVIAPWGQTGPPLRRFIPLGGSLVGWVGWLRWRWCRFGFGKSVFVLFFLFFFVMDGGVSGSTIFFFFVCVFLVVFVGFLEIFSVSDLGDHLKACKSSDVLLYQPQLVGVGEIRNCRTLKAC